MEQFGDYTLVRPLARGGMAELFYARRGDGTEVVVKRLLPEMEVRPDVVDLFLTEADIGQLLHHENVVRVLDAGEVDGHYFLAMEYVDGLDADHLLADAWQQQRPLPTAVAVRICVDALRGLHYAHTLRSPQGTHFGLVHRDVSPDNLFLSATGFTKLLDFGISRRSDLTTRTRANELKGKIPFMSPEQINGERIDARSDLFSLGSTLYWLLTGARPFAGDTDVTTLFAVLHKAHAPVRGHVDDAGPFGDVIEALLQKRREDRPPSALEVVGLLERCGPATPEAAAALLARVQEA